MKALIIKKKVVYYKYIDSMIFIKFLLHCHLYESMEIYSMIFLYQGNVHLKG